MYYVRTIQLLKTSEINKQLKNYILDSNISMSTNSNILLNSNISISKRTIQLKQLVN